MEVEEVQAPEVEVAQTLMSKTGKTRQRKLNKYIEEWMKLIPSSSNVISMNEHDFIDHYTFWKDVVCLDTNGYKLFMFFFSNRFGKALVCNPWVRNLGKLIFPKVYVAIELFKALIKSYKLVTKSFLKHYGSILCTLDCPSFIESFGLECQMSMQIDIEKFQKKFERNKSF